MLISELLSVLQYFCDNINDSDRNNAVTECRSEWSSQRVNRLVFEWCSSGPPESMREHVVAASKAMKMGDWRTCHSFIINEKMNSKVWDLFPEALRVQEMLVRWRLQHLTEDLSICVLIPLTCAVFCSSGRSRRSLCARTCSPTAACTTPSGAALHLTCSAAYDPAWSVI